MKKEVTVCDFPSCRHLADDVCCLCKRDICGEHSPGAVVASMTVEKPTGESGSVVNMRREYRAKCCISCQIEAQEWITFANRSADEILQPFSISIIEFLQACAASAKLKRGS